MGKVKCPDCKGLIRYWKQDNFDGKVKVVTCHTCNGTGYVWKKPTPEQMRKVAELIRKEGK